MMRILSIVNDEIDKDPRASKFRDTLRDHYEVYTICSSFDRTCDEGKDIIIRMSSKSKLIGLVTYWLKVIIKVKEINPDIILIHNYFMALPGWIASKLYRKVIAYDAYEFYVPQRGVKMTKRDYFFFLTEKFTIKRSSIAFSANLERSRLMKSAYKLSKLPIPVLNIPSFVREVATYAKPVLPCKTIVYEGFISFTRYVDLLVDSFEYLPNVFHLVIVGGGPDENKLRSLIESKPYKDRIDYRGRINVKEIIPLLSSCYIGFVGYPFSNLNNRYCSPNKIYEYPAAGIPFVSTNQSTIFSMTKDYHICDFYYPMENGAKSISNAIQIIDNNYAWYKENTQFFIDSNTWDKEACKIIAAFNGLTHSTN